MAADHFRTEHSEHLPMHVPFDICQSKSKSKSGSALSLKPSLFAKNKEKRKEQECFKSSEKHILLRKGMVLLRKYISLSNQINIIKKCQELGCGPGGFYQPVFRDGAKLHLQMMCLGKNWDPEMKSYGDRRSIDDACPPSIPVEFNKLVEQAILDSQVFIKQDQKLSNVEDVLPGMSPDICIVNFYTESGKLGLHQDRDETPESLKRGLPVVSFSIGDSAEFLYGDNRDPDMAHKVVLESGDVLIFGGEARHIFHGVPCITRNSAPSSLVEESNLLPGRLNLTFRKY
ncbi:alpha-ketoglutarate-dependent dioxygenase AlkB-like [Telopea speciosissima]|uniref:alpha-ketoglutarate-dependent dioxygenase AlkB-like n=1 Tax=Telopea speciosissima TaxID=54955 RepID=UPI001CC77211|nr:alpha-ketoglutarate-dependent dioxygenase AlkB-like [Telopea speciosissima]